MNAWRTSLVILAALTLLSASARATDLGDDAPALKVETWIKGGPIDLAAGKDKNVYVVEFWATWCSPCRRSIPHLTELQKKYRGKGVVVIGVSVDEGEKRKTRGDVAPFVRERGDQMDYVVALDDADRSTRKAYMESFLFDSIPNAFVIDRRGKLAWAGQPQETPSGGLDWSRLDQAVADIVAGTYDLKAAQQADRERRVVAESRRKALETMNRYFELAKSSAQPAGAEKLGQETFTALGQDAALLNDFAWRMLTDEELKFRDLKLALQVAKAAYDAAQGVSPSITDTYARALFDNGKRKEAIAYQKKAIKLAEDDPALREELEGTLKKYEAAGQ